MSDDPRRFIATYDTLPPHEQQRRRGEYLSLRIAFTAEELLRARDGQNGFRATGYDGNPDSVRDPVAREVLLLLRRHNRNAGSHAGNEAIHRAAEGILAALLALRTPQDRIELSDAARAWLDPT